MNCEHHWVRMPQVSDREVCGKCGIDSIDVAPQVWLSEHSEDELRRRYADAMAPDCPDHMTRITFEAWADSEGYVRAHKRAYAAPQERNAVVEQQEEATVAWLVIRCDGDHELVFSPLTDDTFIDEGDEAWPLRSAGAWKALQEIPRALSHPQGVAPAETVKGGTNG